VEGITKDLCCRNCRAQASNSQADYLKSDATWKGPLHGVWCINQSINQCYICMVFGASINQLINVTSAWCMVHQSMNQCYICMVYGASINQLINVTSAWCMVHV
jgi:hypothetical protein